MTHQFDHLLGAWGAGLVALVIALEAMGLPLPGESMLIGSAIFCATTHRLSIVTVLFAASIGAIMGDNAGFLIGRRVGTPALLRYGSHIGLTADRLALGRSLFRRYGGSVVFVGRFVAVLRTFVALLAGANGMGWRRFLIWNALGAVAWSVGYGLAAYEAGRLIRRIEGPVGLALGFVVLVCVAALAIVVKRNEKRLIERARREEQTAPA